MSAMFEGQAVWFGVPAAIGSAVFLLKLLLMLFGGDGAEGDFELDGDVDGFDSDDAFSVLSVQGIAAFAAGFGWGGLGAHLGMGWGVTSAMGCGLVAGIASAWLLGIGIKAVYDLQSSGTVDAQDALGATGEVYAEVPAHGEGSGQVRLVIRNRQRIYDAVSEEGVLQRSTRIRVAAVMDGRTVSVVAD